MEDLATDTKAALLMASYRPEDEWKVPRFCNVLLVVAAVVLIVCYVYWLLA